jgi:hypothetical protein
MTSGLTAVALGVCFLLCAIASAIELVRDVPPFAAPPNVSPVQIRVVGWIQLVLYSVVGVLMTIAGVLTALFVAPGNWPWTAVGVGIFLAIGIFRLSMSLRRSRAPQSL